MAVACGYLGAALGVCMLVPQIVRSLRDRHALGVSPLSWALTGLSCGAWLLYGLRAHELPQVPGNAIVVAGTVVIVLMVPSRVGERSRAAMFSAAALALVLSALLLSPVEVGLIAFAIGTVSALPQMIRSLIGSAGAASAVSVPSWLLRAVSQVCWLVFAVAERDAVVFTSAIFLLVSSVVLCVVEVRRRRDTSSSRSQRLASAGPGRRHMGMVRSAKVPATRTTEF